MVDRSKYPPNFIGDENDREYVFIVHMMYGSDWSNGETETLLGVHKTLEGATKTFKRHLSHFIAYDTLPDEDKAIVIDMLDYYDHANGDTLYVSVAQLED